MLDLRPVGFVIGYLVMALGATMLLPLGAEIIMGGRDAQTFVFSTIVTVMTGGLLVLACQSSNINRINIQQTFIVTTLSWLVLPFFGAIPFWIGSLNASFTASFFESMSGLTTTGSSNFTNLNDMSPGLLFWRSLLQWIGGVGIVVVAMVFLPTLRVGGMQIFRSEGFDTLGKILPRAAEIAKSISYIYLGITIACIFSYLLVGMTMFEALNHAFTTVSTGGFSTYDASFGTFSGLPEYVASFFMILASLPFVRYVQLIAGTAKPLLRDSQIQTYLAAIMIFALVLVLYRLTFSGDGGEEAFREAVFNVTSIMSGTGYASVDYNHWGSFPIALFFIIGLIGGCSGSTACSVKIFRYQLLFASVRSQIKRIHSPSAVAAPRYGGKVVTEDVMSSVMSFFVMFMVTLVVVAVLLSLTGLDAITSISGAATAIANIGPGLGDEIGPAGTFAHLPDTAKWILSIAMLIGRLEIIAVYVLFTRSFWAD